MVVLIPPRCRILASRPVFMIGDRGVLWINAPASGDRRNPHMRKAGRQEKDIRACLLSFSCLPAFLIARFPPMPSPAGGKREARYFSVFLAWSLRIGYDRATLDSDRILTFQAKRMRRMGLAPQTIVAAAGRSAAGRKICPPTPSCCSPKPISTGTPSAAPRRLPSARRRRRPDLTAKLKTPTDLTVLDIDPGPTPTQERMSLALLEAVRTDKLRQERRRRRPVQRHRGRPRSAGEPIDSLSVIHLGEHLERLTAQDLRKLDTQVPLETLRAVVDLAPGDRPRGPRGPSGRHACSSSATRARC